MKINQDNDTYEVSERWIHLSEQDRISEITAILKNSEASSNFVVEQATGNGFVVLRIEENLNAATRGLFLLDLEEKLKQQIDYGITLWLQPVGDKSKLRQLRGVEVRVK